MLGEPPSGTMPRPVIPLTLRHLKGSPVCARRLKSSILCRKGALFKRCDADWKTCHMYKDGFSEISALAD